MSFPASPKSRLGLLGDLGVEAEAKKEGARTPHEERIIAGFEEVQRFVEKHGRAPQHGEDRDIFERLYAVRLVELDECRTLLPVDGSQRASRTVMSTTVDEIDDDELLTQLGAEDAGVDDITDLRHVRSSVEKRAAEEIANRQKCEDFDQFKPGRSLVRRPVRGRR